MSAHTVLRQRSGNVAAFAALNPRGAEVSVRLKGASMRLMEMGLALAAIATALLLGVGR